MFGNKLKWRQISHLLKLFIMNIMNVFPFPSLSILSFKKKKNMTLSLFSTPTKSVWMPVTDSISSSVPRRYFCLCLIGHSAGIWPESHFWRLAMHPWNFPERNILHSHSTLSVFAQDYVGRFPHLNDKFNKWNLNLYCVISKLKENA